MKEAPETIGIFPNPSHTSYIECANWLADSLSAYTRLVMSPGMLGLTSHPVAPSSHDFYNSADLVLVLGGDGTMLMAARGAAISHTPILGINMGRIGFLTAVEKKSLSKTLPLIVNGQLRLEERMMLDVQVKCGKSILKSFLALNDATIARYGFSQMVCVKASINQEFLGTYYADGLLVATPTGSTAYALSAGGPVINPTIDVLLLCPICPQDLRSRPIILGGNDVCCLQIMEHKDTHCALAVDGHDCGEVTKEQQIIVKKSAYKTPIATLSDLSFYEILRAKL